jgi:hypothetical protein
MTFVSRVPVVPSAFGNQTSAGGEEAKSAGQKKDLLHIQFHIHFVSLSGATLRDGRGLLYGV